MARPSALTDDQKAMVRALRGQNWAFGAIRDELRKVHGVDVSRSRLQEIAAGVLAPGSRGAHGLRRSPATYEENPDQAFGRELVERGVVGVEMALLYLDDRDQARAVSSMLEAIASWSAGIVARLVEGDQHDPFVDEDDDDEEMNDG